MELADLRINFGKYRLQENDIPDNPIKLFKLWLDNAQKEKIPDFNAMVVSTAYNNKPSSRIVLLKDISEDGKLFFFTNYSSRKGFEIESNGFIAINFFWSKLERQVRIEGKARRTTQDVSSAYFNSRPVESRSSTIVSPQSQVIDNLEILREKSKKIANNSTLLTIPENWGGYQVEPEYYEFWQGGADRLHDRIVFKSLDHKWIIQRLAP